MNPIDILEHHIKQRRGELSFSASKPKAVKQWAKKLSELPLGDTCLQLWQALTEIHELECDENLRFELLHSIAPSVQCVCKDLYAIISKSRQVQYNEHHEQVLQLLLGIHAFMLLNYYDIVQRIDEQWQNNIASWQVLSRFKIKTTLIKASFYGLKMASQLLYYQALFNVSLLSRQWFLIHQIYDLSKKNKQYLVQLGVFVDHLEYEVKNIEQQYKQILLFELLSAPHLSETDLSNILCYSHEWANYLQFAELDDVNAYYRIAIQHDAPIYFQHYGKYRHLPANVAVSNIDLIHFFDNEMILNQKFKGSSTLQLYIHHILTHGYKRQEERFAYVAQLDAYLGFADIVNVLSPHDHSQGFVARHRLNNYMLQVLDKSKSGYKIRWQDDIPLLLQKGNLLLIKEKNDDGRMNVWQIAVVRWIQRVDKTTVEIGVEIVSRQQFIVKLHSKHQAVETAILTYTRHKTHGEQYALILDKKSQLHKEKSLNMTLLQVTLPIQLARNNALPESHYVQKYDVKLQKVEESDILYRILTQSILS